MADQHPYKYLLSYTVPLMVVCGAWIGGPGFYLGAAYVMVFLAVLDFFGGEDLSNPSEEAAAAMARDPGFLTVVRAYVPLHVAMLLFVGVLATSASAFESVGAVLSLGVAGALPGITVGDELTHSRGRLDRMLGRIPLAAVSSLHIHLEHLNHHRYSGTDRDTSTAWRGESMPFHAEDARPQSRLRG